MKKMKCNYARRILTSSCAAILALTLCSNTVIPLNAEGEETEETVTQSYYNPYYGGWSNCTWSAWQLVYEATGVALPSLGNAGQWYANAATLGYEVSSEPRANSVGVWSGHVVYVVDFDGSQIYIKEGGFLGRYNECWTDAYSARYGEALIGYIYIPGDMSEITAPTYSEQVASTASSYTTSTETVERAIADSVADQNIENLEEDIIKKYDPELVEEKKAEEVKALKDLQEEESQLSGSTSSSTTSVTKSSQTASLTASILAPITAKKSDSSN